ncbi:hypothetical protein AArcSl_1174 [Halalkaliarchaeum desulfuricum]|uniref:Uncharacterized protein n=1 Tax=Halalkaliarchaeum desulfuricum TaxID=2055893 RepID=A0A343TI85_9EURY|nr:hypothetical protein AArcSl_1174 [Halalkaliarchaeum desulfuricum]
MAPGSVIRASVASLCSRLRRSRFRDTLSVRVSLPFVRCARLAGLESLLPVPVAH